MTQDIRIASAILLGPDGRTLLVRKRGSRIFMQAGGKIDPGETPREALARELQEELGLVLPVNAAEHLGRFEAPAANEHGQRVVAEIFRAQVAPETIRPAAEIEEVMWIDPAAPPAIEIAPLSREQLLPIAARGRSKDQGIG